MINNLQSSKSMITKKLHLILFTIFCGLNSIAFSQGVYFQETGRGFSIGSSYSARKVHGRAISIISGEFSARLSKSVSANVEYANLSMSDKNYSALIPSITVQTSSKKSIGLTASIGYMDSKLSADKPILLFGFGFFLRINSEGVFQVYPNLSFSHSIVLKSSSYEPDPAVVVGTDFALRLAENVFIVAGPQLLLTNISSRVVNF